LGKKLSLEEILEVIVLMVPKCTRMFCQCNDICNMRGKKILYTTIGGRRRVGKPRKRWIDTVEEDAKKLMGVRNWKRTHQDREKWKGLIREAKARHRAVVP
jgi:hypothetical protein